MITTKWEKNDWVKIEKISVNLPKIQIPKQTIFGIDPGSTKLGLASISHLGFINLWMCNIVRDRNAITRIKQYRELLSFCFNSYSFHSMIFIEGASYDSNYRQVELEQMRTTACIWGIDHGFDVYIIPPQSVRKQIFGNGKTSAHNVWTNIPKDTAAALSCALLGVSH